MITTASSPLEQFLKWEKDIPDAVFLRQPFKGVWKTWTWAQAGDESRKMVQGLKSLNLPPRSHVAILSKNCAHWIMADLAIMMAGYISIPVYPTLTAHSIQLILEHSDAKAILIGKLDDFVSQKDGIPSGIIRIGIDTYGISAHHTWEELVKQQSPLKEIYQWQKDEILTIIYTSGTTGQPKGVMHTVEAFDMVLPLAIKELQLPQRPALFSYLPLSHIAERIGIEMNGLYSGAFVSFAESLDSFAKNLADTQPDIFFAVPRIWGKLREGILKKLPQRKLNLLLSLPLISSIIKKSIRKKLGLSKASHIYSAAAPLSIDIQRWFSKLGITIFQAYGMTEDCVYSHFCHPRANKFGTVGKPMPGLQVKIADDGELRLKSKGNMRGYYKETELTAQAFDEEKYLKTGDMGEYDKEGYLIITGRVKDQFKTDKGKYISPAPVEVMLLADTDIEQACVIGTGIPQPMALVALSDAGKNKSKEELSQRLAALMASVNASLEKFEMLEKIVVMKDSWTIANGLITPTLKVKRNEIEKIHLPKYPAWFQEKDSIIWEK